ncbi:MAG: VWA domain-containing protein [Planctomycetes bacterium]|nr:VWA domain-containing protein [Planctomycetota bacterium]
MALRFRCEHCGKRLQVDQEPGVSVMCPYCRNTVVVPADAQQFSAEQAAQQEAEEPVEQTAGDSAIAFIATYLPSWGTSVVLHVALILVSLATWSAFKQPAKVEYETQAVTKEVKKFIQPRRDLEKSRSLRKSHSEKTSSFVFKMTNNPIPDVSDNRLKAVEVIGVGGGGFETGGIAGFGTGRGVGGDAGFFGVGGVASKIVFVVDRSGSMTDSIMYVKHELKRSIGVLKPNQQFFVIFYSSGPPKMMPVRQLLPATEANKQAAYEFIDNIVPIGQTDPKDSLTEAFKLGPELIYLLTDGEFDKEIVGHIEKLNRGKQVTVNTICFIYSNGEPILMEIANKNNGTYKYVGEDDLNSLE